MKVHELQACDSSLTSVTQPCTAHSTCVALDVPSQMSAGHFTWYAATITECMQSTHSLVSSQAFSMFRAAGILQGVYKRALQGNASDERAKMVGSMASDCAALGLAIAHGKLKSAQKPSIGSIFQFSDRLLDLKYRLVAFMERFVYVRYGLLCVCRLTICSSYPAEAVFEEQHAQMSNRWGAIPPILEELKEKARAAGLWNLFLPDAHHGAGLTNVEYGTLCEIMGRSFLGPEVCMHHHALTSSCTKLL